MRDSGGRVPDRGKLPPQPARRDAHPARPLGRQAMPQGSSAAAPTAPLIAADSPGALFPDFFGSGSPGAPSARRWTFPLIPRPPDPGQVTASAAPGALPVPIRQRLSRRRGARRRRGAHGNHRHHRGLRGPDRAGPHWLRRRPGVGARVSLRCARIPARHAAGAADGLRAAGGALPRRRSMRELSTQLRMRSAIGKSTGAMPVPGRARLAAVRRRPSPTPERDLRQFRRDAPVAMLRCASR